MSKALKDIFKTCKEQSLCGRYLQTKHIKPLLSKHNKICKIEVIGQSVLHENIYSITIGTGEKRVLMWSQMHGNESTTTKAVFDLLNYLAVKDVSKSILEACTIVIIPILNPDGAKVYTRLNANNIDLNRDAQNLTQPESKVLRATFNNFKPHYCFNLHGQRTIFSAGKTNNPASLSFLSPAQNQNRTITENRKTAMAIIVKMNTMLQKEIPNQVGIYNDAFNINCVGDTFQSFNVPTILFEAGHCKDDYNREKVRQLVFQSYIIALNTIANNESRQDFNAYFKIPKNEKLFFDIIIKNALYNNKLTDIAVQYQEKYIKNAVHFIPKIIKIENLNAFYAHKYLNANGFEVLSHKNEILAIGNEIDFVMINNVKCGFNANN